MGLGSLPEVPRGHLCGRCHRVEGTTWRQACFSGPSPSGASHLPSHQLRLMSNGPENHIQAGPSTVQ